MQRWIRPKIYVYTERMKNCLLALAIAEDGTLLASELVADEAQGRKFLLAVDYIVNDPFGHRKAYDRKYPHGYTVEYVSIRDREFHKGLRYARKQHTKKET